MNYTENYHLPQWEETDRILRTDFNEAMTGIEEGITEAKAAAEDAGKVTYAAGYYIGRGSEERKIVTGFQPKMVLIHGVRENTQAQENTLSAFFVNSPPSRILTYTDDGFTLHSHSSMIYPQVNVDGRPYAYVAFR